MFANPRLAMAFVCFKLIHARARAVALARAACRRFAEPIAHGVGLVAVALAVLCALVCVTGCPAPTPPANGSISLAWSIIDASNAPTTCEQVGARSVALRLRNRAGGSVIATAFPCPSSPGTAQIAPGLYDVSFQLNAADGTQLATVPDQAGVSIVAGQLRPLAPIMFTVSSQGTLVLSLATGATTNCQPTSAGGAGITGNTITLEFVGGGCSAVTFARRRGAEQRGTYTVVCSSPQIATCIEKGETLTTSLAPGSYLVRARGKVGAVDCWQRDDTLNVPAGGRTLSRTLGLLHVNGPGC